MAFIAIIHVPDHTAVEDVLESGAPINVLADQGRLVGLFEYPTRKDIGCTGCTRKGMEAWGRDPLGFIRCTLCGKRNKRIRRFLINALFDFLGANLYEDAPAAFRTPEGYGPPPQ